ncbi:MAG: hypothetical protein R8G01_09245 [Ilumatobacteraceae bacterium]|nr:hypothetical protein [Ilumatobacteraceae bacterium]
MLSESSADTRRRAGGPAFWFRLTDNLFRRLVWFLVPIVILGLIGFSQARNTPELYQSSATLSTTGNPLVPSQDAGGVSANYWESQADAGARMINERLRTDSFITSIAEQAGLGPAVDSGLVGLDVIRTSIWAGAGGSSIISVRGQWNDPQTAYQLVEGTVTAYQAFLSDTLANDSAEAEVFYIDQLAALEIEQQTASDELDEFVATLPAEGGITILDQIELERLSENVRSVVDRIEETQENIDLARLTQAQLSTDAGRGFSMIDPPAVPDAPVSALVDRAVTALGYLLLGMVIAAAALVVTTVLDRSVASPADLLALDGVSVVATAPRAAALLPRPVRGWRVWIWRMGMMKEAST